jgi:hypothetical protein
MKLYTEEEIRKFFNDETEEELSIDELIKKLTPIELPSDEELWLMSEQHAAFCGLQNFFDDDEIILIRHHWIKGYEKAIKDFSNKTT